MLTTAIGVLAALAVSRTGCSSTKAPEQAAPTDTSGVKVTGKSNSLFGFFKPYRIDIHANRWGEVVKKSGASAG